VDFETISLVLAAGFARVMAAVLFLPFFSRDMLGGLFTKNILVLLIVIGLAPVLLAESPSLMGESIAILLFSELLIGLVLGLALALPFWVAYAIGQMIDNQRGATMSDTLNPAIGIEVSPLASFMTYFWSATFLLGGGMLSLLEILRGSYQLLAIGAEYQLSSATVLALVGLMQQAVIKGMVLAGPVIVSMFLCEMTLGLLSRFAPQLNAFSMAMTLKSLIAVAVMLIYFGPLLPGELMRLAYYRSVLDLLEK
jgi:type III secretion protein T